MKQVFEYETSRAKVVFEFIVGFKRAHDGISPSMREILEGCDISSTSLVNYYLERLVDKGLIERYGDWGKSRNLMVVGGYEQACSIEEVVERE
jgi:repressor LexA